MSSENLLTLPSEVRLLIIGEVANEVWPAFTVFIPKLRRSAPQTIRFGFFETTSWPQDKREPIFDERKESGLPFVCKTLRNEFLRLLAVKHELNLQPYEDLVKSFRTVPTPVWYTIPRVPRLKAILLTRYAMHVQRLHVTTLPQSDAIVKRPMLHGSLLDVFPSLKKVFLDAKATSFGRFKHDLDIDTFWTMSELEALAVKNETQAVVKERHDSARAGLALVNHKQVTLDMETGLGSFDAMVLDSRSWKLVAKQMNRSPILVSPILRVSAA